MKYPNGNLNNLATDEKRKDRHSKTRLFGDNKQSFPSSIYSRYLRKPIRDTIIRMNPVFEVLYLKQIAQMGSFD